MAVISQYKIVEKIYAQINLNPGDVVVLYTDGVTEAFDINGVQYGLEKLCEVVRENRHKASY